MPRNNMSGIPDNFGHIVRGPDGNWVEATPTQAPTRTPTNTNLEQLLYGDAADNMRTEEGGVNWGNLLNLILGGRGGWKPDEDSGFKLKPTPTPGSDSPKRDGDMELIIKKKQYKPPKEEKKEESPTDPMLRPRKVSPMSGY